MAIEQNDANFDEGRWTLLRMRGVAIIALVLYPIWTPIYHWINADFYDPQWQRLLAVVPPSLVALLSFKKDVDRTKLRHLFNFFAYSMTGHVFFLVYMNDITTLYVLGAYCMIFCAGLSVVTNIAVVGYFALFLATTIVFCWLKPIENAYILFAGVGTSTFISIWVQSTMDNLTTRISKSRALIESKNKVLDSMLNSLGQGFLSFGPDGLCLPVFSRACVQLLETEPGSRAIWEVLKIEDAGDEFFQERLKSAFAANGDFHGLEMLLPKTFPHSQDRQILLEYRPTMREDGAISEVVVIATDRTDVIRAEKAAEAEKRHSMMVSTIVRQKRFFRVFIGDFTHGLDSFAQNPSDARALEFKRFLHSVKGGTGMFFMDEIAKLAHTLEEEWKSGQVAGLLEKQLARLEEAMAEFMIANTEVLGSECRSERQAEIPISAFSRIINQPSFPKVHPELQNLVLDLTLQPSGRYFDLYSDLVTRLARQQGKRMKSVRLVGGDTAIFPEPYHALFSSLVHVFRNAVDHGLETPDVREAAGKPREGQITVEFARATKGGRDWLTMRISDDGGGIDPQKLREKLRANGETAADTYTDEQILQVVFNPGFSTKTEITELSGRGVGLDAVKSAVVDLGGSIAVESTSGKGTVFTLQTPVIDAREYLARPQLAA